MSEARWMKQVLESAIVRPSAPCCIHVTSSYRHKHSLDDYINMCAPVQLSCLRIFHRDAPSAAALPYESSVHTELTNQRWNMRKPCTDTMRQFLAV